MPLFEIFALALTCGIMVFMGVVIWLFIRVAR